MTKKTDRKSKIAEAPTARKLTVKKNTLKDLTVPARGQQVQGGIGPVKVTSGAISH